MMKFILLSLLILLSCENSNEAKSKEEKIDITIENLSSIQKLEFVNKNSNDINQQAYKGLGLPFVQIKVTFYDEKTTLLNKDDLQRLNPDVKWYLNEQELFINNSVDYTDKSKFQISLNANEYSLKFIMTKDSLVLKAESQFIIEHYPKRSSMNFTIHEFPNRDGKLNYNYFTSPENGNINNFSILTYNSNKRFEKITSRQAFPDYKELYSYRGLIYYGSSRSTRLFVSNYQHQISNHYEIEKYKETAVSITNIYAYNENVLLGLSNGDIWSFNSESKEFNEIYKDSNLKGKIVQLKYSSDGFYRSTSRGLERYTDTDGWKTIIEVDELTAMDLTTSYRTGITAIGTKSDGLYLFENDLWTNYTKEDHGLSSNSIVKVDYLNNGRFYFATENSIYYIEDKKIYYLEGSDQFNNISDFYPSGSTFYISFEGGIALAEALNFTLISSN